MGVANKCSSKSVSVRLLKLHGRWKTDTAKDTYVQEIEPILPYSVVHGCPCLVLKKVN